LDSKALTKIQALIVSAIIVVGAIAGAYTLLSNQGQSAETIKIGITTDLDAPNGKHIWQGAVLAAEQLNAEGGILGKRVEVIGEDSDFETEADLAKLSSSLTRLLTYHKVDYIIGSDLALVAQDTVAEHKKIFLAIGNLDESTQRVLDNYDKYKYYFRVGPFNQTSIFQGITDSLLGLRENTGFNKVGVIAEDTPMTKGIMEGLNYVLPEIYGFDLVYEGTFPVGTFDFASYLATAEVAGTEILVPLIGFDEGIPFAKEWYDRQSPMLVYGGYLPLVSQPESWEWTNGKCEYICVATTPIVAGYPWTSRTMQAREAYIDRWGQTPQMMGAFAYDALRFILPDAIKRAGTFETDTVIESLEETSIETSNARNFVFTSSHDVMMGENPNDIEADFMLVMVFQWQSGELLPVYPKKTMDEAGTAYKYPPWQGPWSGKQVP